MAENWTAVGEAVTARMHERRITQRQLAERSKVSPATIRQIQHGGGSHRHSLRTLEALSVSLGWPPRHLDDVLHGRPGQDEPGQDDTEYVGAEAALQSRLSEMERLLHKLSVVLEERLGDVVDVIYNMGSDVDVTIKIRHARHDR